MKNTNFKTVYSANGALQAINVQNILEQAGLVTAIASSHGHYLDVQVHFAKVQEAIDLLNPQPSFGEILVAPTAI